MCHATKGNDGDLRYAYTNSQCNWRATEFQGGLPYDVQPELTRLTGWSLRMAHGDLLHVFHLGVGRDLYGSAIKLLVQRRFFNGRAIKQRLASATRSLQQYARQHGKTLARRKLSHSALNWVSGEFPELKTKGSDTMVIGQWLAWLVHTYPPQGLEELSTAIWTADVVLSVMGHNKTFFLSPQEQRQIATLGELFCQTYLRLAYSAVESNTRLYRTRPKFHILQHIFGCTRTLNYQRYATWLDEDTSKN